MPPAGSGLYDIVSMRKAHKTSALSLQLRNRNLRERRYGCAVALDRRAWLAHYALDVPHDVEIPDEPICAAVYAAARRWPERPAVDFFGATTTYAELAAQVDRAAGALAALGVGAGDRVALVLPNSTAHVIAFHAAHRLGAVVVEHNPTYTSAELAHQLTDSGAVVALVWQKAVPKVTAVQASTRLRAVVAVDIARDLPRTKQLALRLPVAKARRLRGELRGPAVDVPDWHALVAGAQPIAADHPWPAGSDVALLQYTGGTTGVPKGAVLTHRNVVANTVQGDAWVGFRPGEEVVYGALPFFHGFGLTLCLALPARFGATLVAFPKFDVEATLAAQRRLPATFFPGVAPMYERLVSAARAPGRRRPVDLSSIRFAFAGAMPISAAVAAAWEEATGGLLIEGYGMTETAPVALGNPCTEARRPGTLGLPFPSTEIRVVGVVPVDADPDEIRDAAPEPDGSLHGELLIRGPQVFSGYWNRPEETAQQLLPGGWVRTGDVVVYRDGVSTLVDRIKEVIVSRGFKVYPSQVEEHLRRMPGIRDVAVVGLPGSGSDEHVAAAVVLDEPDGAGVTLAALREWGERKLARYALPRELIVLTELPRSQIGKVLRRAVRDLMLARRATA